ncbi:hypothetical protein KP509_28G007900 [Ceratopteris richardii]|uniref:Myb-like domain-containing protein n=1 Tax=Ceratopteris richardii TaxID=49495 RepID=A0A8T2RBW0_CERRI|nr:hypothetical protein KP509_28G007900 [Ceratopteris richardii]
MAVSSSPSGTQSYHTQHPQQQQGLTATVSAGDAAAMPGALNGNEAHHCLKHDPGIATEWSPEEQKALEDGLTKYASETPINKYIKIAATLPEKTVRDVALRCRWMLKRESEKRRKADEQTPPKKSKDKKDKLVDCKPAAVVQRSAVPAYAPPALALESDDGIPNEAIGGTAGQLLEQNLQIINQIKANITACKVQENTDLLVRFRDNIMAIANRWAYQRHAWNYKSNATTASNAQHGAW